MSFDQRGFYTSTGRLLKKHRKRANKTQEDIAKELDMPRASYANIESGRQRAPADVIWRLAIVLNVSIKQLLPVPIGNKGNKRVEGSSVEDTNKDFLLSSKKEFTNGTKGT